MGKGLFDQVRFEQKYEGMKGLNYGGKKVSDREQQVQRPTGRITHRTTKRLVAGVE